MKKKRVKKPLHRVERRAFPEAEKRHAWLSLLMDAYHILDAGVAEGIRLREAQGDRLACAKGCANCCVTHRSIPVYPLELVGISWYATEQLNEAARTRMKERLKRHQKGDPCAFLLDGACAIHPIRPMACRQFNVFTRPCEPGEDAYYTRRRDVLTPLKKFTENAFLATMPFYRVEKASEARRIVKKGLHHTMAKDMQQLNWDTLAEKMDEWDKKAAGDG